MWKNTSCWGIASVCVYFWFQYSSVAILQITTEIDRCLRPLRGVHWEQKSSCVDLSAHLGLCFQTLFKTTTPSSFFFLLLWQQKYPRTVLIMYLPQQLWTGFWLLVISAEWMTLPILDQCLTYAHSVLESPCWEVIKNAFASRRCRNQLFIR